MKRLAACALILIAADASAQAPPEPEVPRSPPTVDLPSVPSFALSTYAGGAHTVQELRVHGRQQLDTKLVARGYVIWIYDCKTQLQKPGDKPADVQKRIDDDPTLCERPKFYLGDTRDTSPDRGLWVVDVPRAPNKLEKQHMTKDDLAKWPKPPAIAVGDFVSVTGKLALASPHGDANSDGLLVYESVVAAEAGKMVQTPDVTAHARKAPKLPAAKPGAAVDDSAKHDSIKAANEGAKALGAKQFDTAVTAYAKAIASWDGNALAWYGLGAARAQRSEWHDASVAFDRASSITPDAAMYEMWSGIAAFEDTVARAREDEARKQNKKPEEVRADLSKVNFDAVEDRLAQAIALEPKLWRAHYYLGKIYREEQHTFLAAEQLTLAIGANAREQGPYIALAEIYRRWDYADLAIKVAIQGTTNVPGANEVSDVWYELGSAYDDQRKDKQAIDAFSKAIETRRDNYKAKFMRGQAYFRIGDLANAKKDLEELEKAPGASQGFARQQASRMLMDIAAKNP